MKSYNQLEPAIFPVQMEPNEFWETTLAQKHALGSVFKDTWGRTWRYAKFAGDLSAGHLVQPAALVNITTTEGYAVSNVAAVIGPDGETYAIKQAIIPVTSPEWTPGAYAGCLGITSDGTGEGQYFRIRTNTATTLYLEEVLTTAITAAGTAELLFMPSNKYKDVVIGAYTTLGIAGPAIGSVQCDVDFSEYPYGWILTHGPGVGILDTSASCTIGTPLSPSSATDGQLIRSTFTTTAPENVVAKLITVADDTITNKEAIVDYCFE